MSEDKMMRLGQVARKLNVGISTIVDSMAKKGFDVEGNPNSKISMEQFNMLAKEFKSSAQEKEEASHLFIGKRHNETFTIKAESEPEQIKKQEPAKQAPQVEEKKETKPEIEKVSSEAPKLEGIKVLGKIDLGAKGRPAAKVEEAAPVAETPKVDPKEAEKPVEQEAPKAETVEKTLEKPKEEVKKEVPSEEIPQAVKSQEPIIAKPEPDPQKEQKTDTPKEIKEEKIVEKPAAPQAPKEEPAPIAEEKTEEQPSDTLISAKADALKGLTVLGKIELPKDRPKKKSKPIASSDEKGKDKKKRPRKRIDNRGKPTGEAPKEEPAPIAEEKTEEQPSDTLISAKADALKGLTVLGKIELPKDRPKKKSKPIASSDEKGKDKKKRPRKRIDNRGKPTGEAAKPGTTTGEGQARPGTARPGQGTARPGQGTARPGQGKIGRAHV